MATSDDSPHYDPEDLRSADYPESECAYFYPDITLSENEAEALKVLRTYRDHLLILKREAMQNPLHPDWSFEAVLPRHALTDNQTSRRSLPAGLRDMASHSTNFRFLLSRAIQPFIPDSLRKPPGLLQWSQIWVARLQDSTTGTNLCTVVLKIIQPSLIPLPDMNLSDPLVDYTFGRQVTMAEHYVYEYPLRDIQGMAVPYCFGRELVTMPSGEQARVLILEGIPGVTMKSWCETFEKASLEEKASLRKSLAKIISGVITAYTFLFRKRVLHKDICLENMIFAPGNQVIIFDFADSIVNVAEDWLLEEDEIHSAASMVLGACRNADRPGFVEWASGEGKDIINFLDWQTFATE